MRLALHRNCVTGEERVLALKAMRKDHLVKKRQVRHATYVLTYYYYPYYYYYSHYYYYYYYYYYYLLLT